MSDDPHRYIGSGHPLRPPRKVQVPGCLDGHASSSPPTRDPAIDDLRVLTIAQARAVGIRVTCQVADGWWIPSNEPEQAEARVDWPKVLDDLAFLRVTDDELARRLGVSVQTAQQIAKGILPPDAREVLYLTALWVVLTGKPLAFLPISPRS